MFMGEKFGRDAIWEGHLANELWQTDIELRAILGEITIPLEEPLDLRVGSRILLNTRVDSNIELRCGQVPLFVGKMGRKENHIAIRVEDKAPKKNQK
jgi:flagellar motor switch protein FliM